MSAPKIFLVLLRRPHRNTPDERRDDPFYELGSFGCTRCHSRNLLHPRRAEGLEGARLAFVQGGHLGFRLVLLTKPITVKVWKNNCEARWKPTEKPFKYTEAPIVACNDGYSDFPSVKRFAHKTDRPTVEAGLASRFRSRARPLPDEMAKQVVEVYDRMRKAAPSSAFASTYDNTMPCPPPKIDCNRRSTYERLVSELGQAEQLKGGAGTRSSSRRCV